MIAARIIVVLRGKSVIFPLSPTPCCSPADRLLLIIPRHFEGLFATHFSPISYAQPASSP